MKSSIVFLLVATACGPAFSENLFTGENDAAALETSRDVVVGTTVLDSAEEMGPDGGIDDSPGTETSLRDASSDVAVEACDCTTLCNGNYALRACESCIEICPTYDGAVPW